MYCVNLYVVVFILENKNYITYWVVVIWLLALVRGLYCCLGIFCKKCVVYTCFYHKKFKEDAAEIFQNPDHYATKPTSNSPN